MAEIDTCTTIFAIQIWKKMLKGLQRLLLNVIHHEFNYNIIQWTIK